MRRMGTAMGKDGVSIYAIIVYYYTIQSKKVNSHLAPVPLKLSNKFMNSLTHFPLFSWRARDVRVTYAYRSRDVRVPCA